MDFDNIKEIGVDDYDVRFRNNIVELDRNGD